MRVNHDENVIVADGFEDFWRGVCSGPSCAGSPPVTFNVHLEDVGVMDEPVDRGERHRWKAERFMMLFSLMD